MRTLLVIPARWQSSRFPGKPLALVAGRTLIERAIDLSRRAKAACRDMDIVVATDDRRIAAEAERLACRAVMTPADLTSGTSRAYAAALAQPSPPRFVVNMQCDAPFAPPQAIGAIVRSLEDGASIATPVVALDWAALDELRAHKAVVPFSGTTCVRSNDGHALWFSKQIIPAIRDEAGERARSATSPVLRHIGQYGYTLDALDRFEQTPATLHERLEGLEQLRFFSTGDRVTTVEVDAPVVGMSGIDTPQDVELAERLIAVHGDPFAT